jgi:Flp pilus assembly protein TadD
VLLMQESIQEADFNVFLYTQCYTLYRNGDYRGALEKLQRLNIPRIPTDRATGIQNSELIKLNNLGCCYLKAGRACSATRAFLNALDLVEPINGEDVSDGIQHTQDSQASIMSSLGLSLLMSSQPAEAFLWFERVVALTPRNPVTWIRMAECHIASENVLRTSRLSGSSFNRVQSSGRSRRFVAR